MLENATVISGTIIFLLNTKEDQGQTEKTFAMISKNKSYHRVTGTGELAKRMELLKPGDEVIVYVNGFFEKLPLSIIAESVNNRVFKYL